MNTQQTQIDIQAIVGDIETPHVEASNSSDNFITQGCTTVYFSCHQC